MLERSSISATQSAATVLITLTAMLFRRKRFIFFTFAVVFSAIALVTFLMPRRYESRMKILVKNERADLFVTPDARNGATVPSDVSETLVNSEIELLTSRDLLVRVVAACRLFERTPGQNQPTPKVFDNAVRDLQRELKIVPVRKSNVIQISYLAETPELAARVLQELSTGYLDAHLSAHRSAGTQAFFRDQAKRYEGQLRDGENELREFRLQNNITSVAEQRDLLLRKAFDAETALRESDIALAEAVSKVGELRKQVQTQDSRVVTQSRSIPNQYSVERLHTMLTELQNRRSQLIVKFRPDDRTVVEVDQEIANTRSALDHASKLVSVEQSTDVNPLRTAFEGDLARAELQRVALQSRRDGLVSLVGLYKARLAELENVSIRNAGLQRTVKESEDNYLLYTRKQEEARIADALDQQKIANVAVTEAPTTLHLAAKPNIPLNLFLGLFAAAFISLGAALFAEFTASRFYTPAELEASTGIPVLATVPLEC